MDLILDWKRVLRRAWSLRLMLLAAALSGLEAALPFAEGVFPTFISPIPPGVFAAVSAVVVAAAFAARLVAQKSMERRVKPSGDRRTAARPRPDYRKADFND